MSKFFAILALTGALFGCAELAVVSPGYAQVTVGGDTAPVCSTPDQTHVLAEQQSFTLVKTLNKEELKVLSVNVSVEYGNDVDFLNDDFTIEFYKIPGDDENLIVVFYQHGCYVNMFMDSKTHIKALMQEDDDQIVTNL